MGQTAAAWLREQPFKLHWLLVLLMAAVIPILTAKTDKPGEFYPFSSFPMYSRFAPDTYYVYITDMKNDAVPCGSMFGIAISDVKKAYDRKLDVIKKASGGKIRKMELPVELKKGAADEVLDWLTKNSPHPERVRELGGLRLFQTNITYRNDRLTKLTEQVGELTFPKP